MPRNLNARKLLLILGVLLILTCLAVLLNIPLLRQISGFAFLTFVPGFLILLILKLNELGLVEKIILSVGLSVAFVMLFGLAINFLSLVIGYTKPLTIVPLLISFIMATIILAAIAYMRNKDITFPFSGFGLTTKEKALLIVPATFPLLSIVGIRIMNLTDNNILIMLLLFLIPAYIIFISFYHSKIPQRLYPSLICLISISLVLLPALRSNHLLGSDVHQMYNVFQSTLDNQHYSVTTPSLVASLASITIFPAIYQAFIKINPEFLIKILIPIIYSITPLVIYITARKYIGGFYAFFICLLFMSQIIFFRATEFQSASLSILFFALAIMVLFHDGINEFARRLFFLLFVVGTVVSHYSTSIIFFFIMLLTWIGTQIANRVHFRQKELSTENKTDVTLSKKNISIITIVLFFATIFFWHAQINVHPFNTAVIVINKTLTSMYHSFELGIETSEAAAALGRMREPTYWKWIQLIVYWAEVIFIAIGGLSILARYKRAVAYPGSGHTKINSLESKFELEYFMLSAASAIILTCAVILPYISHAYTLGRSYFQVLVLLSLFFAVGVILIAGWLRIRPHLIMLLILVPFFMFSTGVARYAYGIPSEIWLASGGAYDGRYVYIHDEDSYAAQWIGKNREAGGRVYSAGFLGHGFLILVSQGKFSYLEAQNMNIAQYPAGGSEGYIFLNADITASKTLQEYHELFATKSKIYTAGIAEIYR